MSPASKEDFKSRFAPRVPYQLFALFLLLLAAIGFATYRYYVSEREAIEREVRNELISIADVKVKQISDWREERIADARAIMADQMTMAVLRKFISGAGSESDRARILAWMQALCTRAHYADAVLANASGETLLLTGRRMGDDAHLRGLVEDVIRRNDLLLRDFHREADGGIHLGLNIPLRLAPGAPIFGALLLGINPRDYLYPLVERWPISSKSAETLLVRRDGNGVLFLNDFRSRRGSAMTFRVPLSRKDAPAVQAVDGVEGNVEGADYNGVPVFAAVRRVPDTNWFLVAKVSANEVRAPIARRSVLVGITGLSLILAAVAGFGFLWRRQQAQFYRHRYQAEVERRALIGHYDYLSRFANDVMLLMNDEGHIIEANDRAVDVYGYSREELLRMNVRGLRHPSELLSLERQWIEGGQLSSLLFEALHRRRDGSAIPVEVSARTIVVEGKVFRQSIIRDITERRAMDEKLRRTLQDLEESESRFRATFEQAAVGMALISLDGRFVRVNQRFCEIAGYGLEEALRLEVRQLTPARDFAKEESEIRKLVSGELESLVLEQQCLRRDGSPVWIDATVSVLRAPGGEPLHFFAVIEDITERRRAEDALQQSESRFRQVVENAPEGIVVVDRRMQILYANTVAARLFGAHSTGELTGRSMFDLTHPEERDVALARSSAVAQGIPAPAVERRLLRLDGEVFPVEISGAPIEYDQQRAAMAFFRDIAERKRTEAERALLEAQLRQAQKMESIGRLAGGVAHDFNNHLTVINGYCDMLQSLLPPQHPAREPVDEIRAAGERAAALTQQLLAFSRKQIAEPRPIYLNDVVMDAGKMLRRLIGEDIEIVTTLDSEAGVVMADRGQMNQVLMNLAVNARDAMPLGGKLSIATTVLDVDEVFASRHPDARPGRYAALSVSDTGVGMSPETQQKIFEPFFTTKKLGTGTGLGLATVYGIVRQNDGWVRVHSDLGKGSTFQVCLPLIDAVPEQAGAPVSEADEYRGSETVLVVEDQEEVRRLALTILRQKGYQLLEAPSGQEALALAESYAGRIDLLLTDVVMPGMNGKELATRLSSSRPSVKVVFTSGYTADAIGHQGVLDPGTAYLAKPFTATQLAAKVREALDGE